MAVLDLDSGCVVIRVVYDGAPMAGKTTSVVALGRGLGAGVYSPADLEGRTSYFDWLDYTGGLFEGHRIRCQIVSVPGQATLAPRRRRLLESADVVVFVGDSSPAGFAADSNYLSGLGAVLSGVKGPPVGVVMQANKRDLADAVPLDQVRAMLDRLQVRTGIIESVATDGSGVREAFVFAVRLALDRVRELMRNGDLPSARPKIDCAEDLLDDMRQAEDGALALATESGLTHRRMHDLQANSSLAATALKEAIQAEATASAVHVEPQSVRAPDSVPALPDEHVASGMIWPAVDGRLILHEMAARAVELRRDVHGWTGVIGKRWRIQSATDAVFEDIDAGRSVLVQWARLHAVNAHWVSKERCIVLAADGAGKFRLWQLVRVERSLRSGIEAALNESTAVLAGTLLSAATSFLHVAASAQAAGCNLPLSLDSIGESPLGPIYTGLMPNASVTDAPANWSRDEVADRLGSELEFVRSALHGRHDDLREEFVKQVRLSSTALDEEWAALERWWLG